MEGTSRENWAFDKEGRESKAEANDFWGVSLRGRLALAPSLWFKATD